MFYHIDCFIGSNVESILTGQWIFIASTSEFVSKFFGQRKLIHGRGGGSHANYKKAEGSLVVVTESSSLLRPGIDSSSTHDSIWDRMIEGGSLSG